MKLTLFFLICMAPELPLGSNDVYCLQVVLAPSGNFRLVLLVVVRDCQREAGMVFTLFLDILRSQIKFAKDFWLSVSYICMQGAENRKLMNSILMYLSSFPSPLLSDFISSFTAPSSSVQHTGIYIFKS